MSFGQERDGVGRSFSGSVHRLDTDTLNTVAFIYSFIVSDFKPENSSVGYGASLLWNEAEVAFSVMKITLDL